MLRKSITVHEGRKARMGVTENAGEDRTKRRRTMTGERPIQKKEEGDRCIGKLRERSEAKDSEYLKSEA